MINAHHDFVWMHERGTTCEGRFICEHLDHWVVRCRRCRVRERDADGVVCWVGPYIEVEIGFVHEEPEER